ncbi:hypothetical protein FOA52_000277 [Chlamydomonas sp. UWO 241]|nr:hypothetical protein FOA52_000277 [Chlamydomonas sp. UWO 241]
MAAHQASCLSTRGNAILGADGQELKLIGANWFGFNIGDMVLMGDPSIGFAHDFATIVYRWKLLGFNAIRLPFSMHEIYFETPKPIISTCTLPTFNQIAYSVTDPLDNVPSNLGIPAPGFWPSHGDYTCNAYIPGDSVINRFVWVVQYLANNGFYVIIDCHSEDPTPEVNANVFVNFWVQIVEQISEDKVASERLIVDILNEPDEREWGWDITGPLFLRVMDAVYTVNPKVLFLVEGTGQQELGANWGDGFQTKNVTAGSPADPNPFFQSLMSKPYLNQVALSPHVYGPSVTFAAADYSGDSLFNRLSNSFGYLMKEGYTHNGITKRFPIVIGETGSFFSDPRELAFMESFKLYLLNTGEANDGRHNAIPHMLYWCWNSDSFDTGGLVDSTEYNIIWKKVRWLNAIGLTPWYKSASAAKRPPPPPYGSSYDVKLPHNGRTPSAPPNSPPPSQLSNNGQLIAFPPSTYGRKTPNGGARNAETCRPFVLLLAAVAALLLSALLL